MIKITNKHNCCGCAACVQSCPKHCIIFDEDEQGFRYPFASKDLCIDCGLCEKVCPCINQNEQMNPLKVLVSKNPDEEVRLNSSSGGIFTIIAETTIHEGGVVFGAHFDKNWEVEHSFTESLEGLEAFRGSKYVQSKIGETYIQALEFLKNGRKVLFTGTPCQIAGLKKFLRKEYDNLLTVDVVCHGVPSPLIWRQYLEFLNPEHKPITRINMRDKSRGWSRYSYLIRSDNCIIFDDYAANSIYLMGFSLNITLRPSCFNCPAKNMKSGADITLADFWGIDRLPDFQNDNKGMSAIMINTPKGNELICKSQIKQDEVNFEFVKKNNPSAYMSPIEPYCRKTFWKLYPKHGINSLTIVHENLTNNIPYKIYNKIRTRFNI